MTSSARCSPLLKLGLGAALLLLGLAIAGFVALSIWFEKTAGAPPPIAGGAEYIFGTPSIDWSHRLAEVFPAGTPETTVLKRLADEGFEVSPADRSARYDWGNGLPCIYTLTATWAAPSGKVTAIRGDYTNACL